MRVFGFVALALVVACAPPEPGVGPDKDGDGYPLSEDCEDHSSGVNPAAVEVCNYIDDDCNGVEDDNCVVVPVVPADTGV
jgi:hypothetical protein